MINDWIKENVINNLLHITNPTQNYYVRTKEEISKHLSEWLLQFDTVELISDCCHYDMVLFIDIFGSAFDIPKNVTAVCYDINQDIQNKYQISQAEAFDMNREELLEKLSHKKLDKNNKHNALYDAKVIRLIYWYLNGYITIPNKDDIIL